MSRTAHRPHKRRRTSSSSSEGDLADKEERHLLLRQLELQCAQDLALAAPVEMDSDLEAGSEQWQGIDSDEEGSDVEDLDEPDVVEWTPAIADDARQYDKAGLRAFMSPAIRQQLNQSTSTPGKNKATSKEDEQERELERLDVSLQTLIASIPENDTAFSALPKQANYTVQKNTPVLLRRALQQTRLRRAKQQAEDDRQSGAVRAKRKVEGAPALTKQGKRMESGEEKARRRAARGIGGVVGKLSASGELRVSRQEVAQVQAMRKQVLPKRRKL